jgi:putative SOS response-associated peptidase YedK
VCGRFTQQRPTSELAEIFAAEDRVGATGGRFNVAPTDEAAVVVQRGDQRAITAYRWGLIPHWATDVKIGSRMFNARAETLADSPAFRDALRRRRCIVPVDSFYEWRREGKVRQPFRVVRPDGRPLALAGLWSGWKNPETGQVVRSFAIITGPPDEVVGAIHDRMPVILDHSEWARWLDPDLADSGELQAILLPSDGLELEAYPVSRLVNNVRFDGPELIERLVGQASWR